MNEAMSPNVSLNELTRKLFQENALGEVLGLLRQQPDFSLVEDRLEKVRSDYELMCDFLLRNYPDQQRAQLFDRLKRLAYGIIQDLRLNRWVGQPNMRHLRPTLQAHSLDPDDLRLQLEAFVQEATLLSLDAPDIRQAKKQNLYERHQHLLERNFVLIALSPQWSASTAKSMTNLLLSPTIDSNDALLFVSAIMLGANAIADPQKVLTMLHIYGSAQDVRLRQRALVGWMFALRHFPLKEFPEISQCIDDLLSDPQAQVDVREMITQVVLCLNTDADNRKLQEDIMPNLINNSHFEITKLGIKEKEDNEMEDILHPEADEEAAQHMEDSLRKMIDMRNKGADIYFGGFSHMKRFSFFYTLCNWFMPFSLDHPQLNGISEEMKSAGILRKLVDEGPFCESDKYSFALGLSRVFTNLPPEVQNLIKSGEGVEIMPPDMDMNSDLYVRRMYLQDLYRFYRLSPDKDSFGNPFETSYLILLINQPCFVNNMEKECRKLRRFLFKNHLAHQVWTLLKVYLNPKNLEDLLMMGSCCLVENNVQQAESYLCQAYDMAPDNERVLKSYAKACFSNHNYERAAQIYGELMAQNPQATSAALNYAIVLINLGNIDEGVKELYKLNYEHPDDTNVMRALAWGDLALQQTDNAQKIYQKLLDASAPSSTDVLNAGFCAWMTGDRERGVQLMVKFMQMEKTTDRERLLAHIDEDRKLFLIYNIDAIEINLMVDMAMSRLQQLSN